MKQSTYTILWVLLCGWLSPLWAQQDICATPDLMHHQLRQDPGLAGRMHALERQVQRWIQANRSQREADQIYTIPVVVHIVWLDSVENVSDQQVMEQLEILNQDFRFLNPNASEIRPRFKDRASDIGIEFCLATVDPEGNPTTGIVRTQGESPTILGIPLGFYDPITNNIKYTENGGADAWPTDQYLNIWVGNIGAELLGLLGYAQLPQSYRDADVDSTAVQALETDGVVIDYRAFGTTGDYLIDPGGRSLTHEVGHWLGLRHIWGDGDCEKDDFVEDTPRTAGASQTCDTTLNTCMDTLMNKIDEPDMVENYMDYALGCASMFTLGQKERMLGYLLNDELRVSLLRSGACEAVTTSLEPRRPELEWRVFPNPSTGTFSIQWRGTPQGSLSLEVLNPQGQRVVERMVSANAHSIQLPQAAAGLYMVRLSSPDHSWVKKVIVQ